MIKLPNGTEYKTILLDTNAIRSMLDEDKQFLRQYLQEFIVKEPHAIMISTYTIIELKPLKDMFMKFLELFEMIPFFLVLPEKSIVEAEYDFFLKRQEPELCKEMIYSVTYVKNMMSDVNELLFKGVIDPNIEQFVKELPNIAHELNSKKSAYELIKSTADYRKHELNIIRKDVENHIGNIDNIADVKLSHFPSLRVLEFVLYKKLKSKKPIIANDVMDIRISAIIPYVDKVITENQQAEFFRQVKPVVTRMSNLEIFTLKDIIELIDKERQEKLLIELRQHANTFREAIINIDRSLYPGSLDFKQFPKGCCGNASEMLARYLYKLGYEVEYIGAVRKRSDGKSGTESHGWLECEGIMIDITADQFPGMNCIIVKPKGKKNHLGFKEKNRHQIGSKPIVGLIREKLETFYQNLDNYISRVSN